MTRPANNGCGEDSYVSHAVIKRNFGGSTPQVTGKMAPFKRANVLNLEELLQSENGLFRKKGMVPLAYLIYLLNIYVKRKTLSHAREKTKKTSISISLPSSKLTISLISVYKHYAIDIADPSSMQDMCHMYFVTDLAHRVVSMA